MSSVINAPDFVSTLSASDDARPRSFPDGAEHGGRIWGRASLFFPILENHGKRTALVYLAAMVVQVVLLGIGVLLLMLVPVGEIVAGAGAASAAWSQVLGRS